MTSRLSTFIPQLSTDHHRKKGNVGVNSDFVGGGSAEHDTSTRGSGSRFAAYCASSKYLANLIVIVVLIDAACTCRDIDARAQNQEAPSIYLAISNMCLVIYMLEFLLYLWVNGIQILSDWIVVVDLVVILSGVLEVVLQLSGLVFTGLRLMPALRLCRILRLTRFLRKLRSLRELHKLAVMMTTCAKTLVWSFLLCFLIMTVWSMLLVEAVNPLLQQLSEEGVFEQCGLRCQRAMSSVMEANLLLFQTVIAGDGWGEIAVPLILNYPQTAIILMGSFTTLVFGVLNLVVAVVVDTFADARQNDVQNLAAEMEDEIEHDRTSLAKLFARIDGDGSGEVTLEELVEGARRDPIFQSRLRVMDIDESDLQMLFEMIDVDGNGSIEAAEFIGPLSRWAHDSKTAPRFIKYNLMQSMKVQEEIYDLCNDCFRHLALQIDKVFGEVKKLREPGRPPASSSGFSQSPSSSFSGVAEAEVVPPDGRPSMMQMNPSKEVGSLLTPKDVPSPSEMKEMLTGSAVPWSMERAVANLDMSLQRLDVFARDAEAMVRKWSELPVDFHRRERDANSAGSNGVAKADVFWAHYMDRDNGGGKRRTVRGQARRSARKRRPESQSSSAPPEIENGEVMHSNSLL